MKYRVIKKSGRYFVQYKKLFFWSYLKDYFSDLSDGEAYGVKKEFKTDDKARRALWELQRKHKEQKEKKPNKTTVIYEENA